MRILAVSGSLRRGSYTTQLLRNAVELAPAGVEVELYEELAAIPPYDEDADVEPAPTAVVRLRQRLAAADAVLVATPEYNSSVPGQLKNALDWASRPFPGNALWGKPTAVAGASTGAFGAVWAQAELRKVLRACGARVLDRELTLPRAQEQFRADGRLLDPGVRAQLSALLKELEAEATPLVAAA